MKAKNSYGPVQIFSNRPFPGKWKRDPWHEHSWSTMDLGVQSVASGGAAVFLVAPASDGETYVYLTDVFTDPNDASKFYARVQTFTPPNYPYPAFGEGFNYLLRPEFSIKIYNDQLSQWTLDH